MAKLVFRKAAQIDLENLYRFIAKQSGSPERAIGYIHRIRARCEALPTFPESGRRRDDIRPGLFIVGFERRVVIAYTLSANGNVEIGRIFYGGRNFEVLLGDQP